MTNWNIPHVQTIGFIHLHSWWVFHWRANVSSPRGLWKFSGTPKATCRQRFPMLFSGGNSPCPRNLFCRNLSYLISVASFFFFFRRRVSRIYDWLIYDDLECHFSSFFECSFFCWPWSDIFFGLSATMVQKSRTTRLMMVYFGGCISTAQMGEFMEWVWKTKAFFFMRKVVIYIFN